MSDANAPTGDAQEPVTYDATQRPIRTDHVSLEPDGRLVFVRSAGWIRMSPNPSGAGGGTGGGASIDGAVTIAGDLYSADGGGRGEAT